MRVDRILQMFGGVLQDVEEQEHQDAGRDPCQERLGPVALHPDPSHGQPQEDGEAGDRAQQDRLSGAHFDCGAPFIG